MRKFLALVLALVMTMSLVTVSAGAATAFEDAADITSEEAVEVLNAMGVLTGNNGKFNPQGKLTRGAGAKIIAYLMLGQAKADKLTATYTVFEDVTDGVGLAAYIEWAAREGIINGYGNGKFGPYDTLTQYAFGKMLLGALGYKSAEEGYTGAGWQKAVYRDATYTGIYDGTETYGACLRDDAARMALGALKANVVAYGTSMIAGNNGSIYWNGELLGNNFAMVDGRIETTRALWTFYPNLTYVPVAADVWGRPGHYWEYGTTFDKFYMDAPVAEYKTVVDDCQILIDFGVAKTAHNKDRDIQFVVNGDAALTTEDVSHAACAGKHGGQGVLTQLFKVERDLDGDKTIETNETFYVVTSIDTYLTYVKDVTTTAHKVQGVTTLEFFADSDVRNGAADNLKKADIVINDSIGYAKKDYVLVNVAEATTEDLAYLVGTELSAVTGLSVFNGIDADEYYENTVANDYDFVAVVGAPTVIAAGKFTGVATDETLATVNGVQTPVAEQYEKSASLLAWANAEAGKSYDFFVDQYGNLIGDANLVNPFTYGVITNMQFHQTALGEKDYADVALVGENGGAPAIVSMFKYNGNAVIKAQDGLEGNPTNASVSIDDVNNDAYWYYETADENDLGVVKVYANGEFETVADAKVKDSFNAGVYENNATITKNNPNITGGTDAAVADDDTIFVVKTINAAGEAVYTKYAGIDEVPTMVNVAFVAVYDLDVAAEFVYVDATRGYFKDNTKLAFVTDTVRTYNEKGETYTYNVWIDGVKTPVKVSKNATGAADLFDSKTGAYELRFSDGVVTEVELKSEVAYNSAWIGGDAEGKGWNHDLIKGLSDANTLVMKNNGSDLAKSINSAKIYKVYFTETAADDDGKFDAATDKLHSVVAADANALKTADSMVVYKTVTGNTGAIDTIFVLGEYLD